MGADMFMELCGQGIFTSAVILNHWSRWNHMQDTATLLFNLHNINTDMLHNQTTVCKRLNKFYIYSKIYRLVCWLSLWIEQTNFGK